MAVATRSRPHGDDARNRGPGAAGRGSGGWRGACGSCAGARNLTQEKADRRAEEVGLPAYGGDPLDPEALTFAVVGKDELFATADVVSLHYVLSEWSRWLVGAAELAMMKPSALLVNTLRVPLIDDAALYDALEKGRIRGAALDVFDVDPLPAIVPGGRLRGAHRGEPHAVC